MKPVQWTRPRRDFELAEQVARAATLVRLRALTPAEGIRELSLMAVVADALAPLADAGVQRARAQSHEAKLQAIERMHRALRSIPR